MTPWPDRVVIAAVLATMGLCFALVFWFVRLHPAPPPAMEWRQPPPQLPLT
ncbi:MAG: hypothetical protein R6W06_12875 [Prochlorococcaceae cyanobacterium]